MSEERAEDLELEEGVEPTGAASSADGDSPEGGSVVKDEPESPEGDGQEPSGEDSPVSSWSEDPDYADYIPKETSSGDGEFKKVSLEEYNSLVEDANNWRNFSGNEVAMAVINHVNGGGKIEDLVSHFDTRDYSKMSPAELLELDMRSNGDFTDEEISDAIENFNDEPSYRQKQKAIELREKFSSRKQNNGSGLVSAYKNNLKKHEEIVGKFNADFESELSKWKNKGSFFDVPVTDGVVQEIRQFVKESNGMILANPDGTINAKRYFSAVFTSLYLPKIVEAKQRKAASKAAEKYVREHQNAGGGSERSGGEVPSNVDTKNVDYSAEFRKTFQTKRK